MTTQTQTQAQANTDFYSVLKDRRSVRHYDPNFKIPQEEIQEILELATKAPSSSNTQSWRFLVVTDQELKKQLLPIANNQQQVVDSSAVIVILGDLEMYKKSEHINQLAVDAGYMAAEFAKQFTENSVKLYSSLPKERLHEVAVFDSGLVAMQIMLIAKAKGYDTVPMGGYDREKLKQFFNIPAHLAPTIILPIGKAAVEGRPTSRLPISEITSWNKI
ncbi:nitroreductase family protein [Paenibacillus sp. NEAU-GSW1]|uniref:nitroreductase family protein n=1 Tax=Paenibacillus sp. NEAU-GSW1 TaxID=2682486 RepID=UPI0012E2DEEF|nr:nitroreductase family protein [Paenibacillus sp. NEAU-GSW1]MUT67627.1 nitroreductase family protein [Paenibacillus sp. NEAU-GSW1]